MMFTKSRSLTRMEIEGAIGRTALQGALRGAAGNEEEEENKANVEDDEEEDDGDEADGPPSWHPGLPRLCFAPRRQLLAISAPGCPYCLSRSCFADNDMPQCLEETWRDVLTKLKTNDMTTLDLRGGLSKEMIKYVESDDIQRFKIGDYVQHVHELADALKSNKSLSSLDFSANDLNDEGVSRLAAALRTNRTLTELVLEENDIGDEGASELADALARNKCLSSLDLGRNFIGDEGRLKLGHALLTRVSARPQQEYLIKNEQTRHCKKGGQRCENHHHSKRPCLTCFPAICAMHSCCSAVSSRRVVCLCTRVVFCSKYCQVRLHARSFENACICAYRASTPMSLHMHASQHAAQQDACICT
jgi:hypothetical protein